MKDVRTYYEKVSKRERQKTVRTPVPPSPSEFKTPCYLFVDQSTKAGYAIYDEEGSLVLSGVMTKEEESLEAFGHEMADIFSELVDAYDIKTIFYEETFLNKEFVSIDTLNTLNYIKSKIKDIGFLKNIETLGVDNTKWKKELAKPLKFKSKKTGNAARDRKADKQEVLNHVEQIFPLVSMTSDDESDAIGMGIAIKIKAGNKGNFYNVTRYNKKLPIFLEIADTSWEVLDDPEELAPKMYARFKNPYLIGGIHELELVKNRYFEEEFRKFLSHRDALVYMRIPRDYRYWGYILLTMNKNPKDMTSEDGSFIIYGSRKYRL